MSKKTIGIIAGKRDLPKILINDLERKKMYENYLELIENYHTRKKRAKYIIDILKKYSEENKIK